MWCMCFFDDCCEPLSISLWQLQAIRTMKNVRSVMEALVFFRIWSSALLRKYRPSRCVTKIGYIDSMVYRSDDIELD